MDRSPIDIDAFARLANEVFRGEAGAIAPGPTEVPSALQAAPASVEQGLDVSAPHGFGVPAGGASFSPSAPPTRPAFGRPASAEAPFVGYGAGQPSLGTAPSFDQPGAPLGFDPQALPGFAPIPHVEDGFGDLGKILSASPAQGFAPPPGLPLPGLGDVPSIAQGVPGIGSGLEGIGFAPFAPSAGGAAFSPDAPPSRPAFGRAVSPEAPLAAYGTGQPRTGIPAGPSTPSVPGLPQASAFDPQSFLSASAPTTEFVPQSAFDPLLFDKGFAPHGTPTSQPGFAGVPGTSAAPGAPFATPSKPRSIDRPTPNAFDFTDAPHLGEFDEQGILRAALDPQNGAPSIEGLGNLPAPRPDPYAGGLKPSASPAFYFLDDRMDYFGDDVPKVPRPQSTPFNAEAVRRDFPVLHQTVNGHPLIWLDNGATTQKPQSVIDRVAAFYANENSNISRSAHTLAANATNAYEDARATVQRFIGASSTDEIVFLRGTTEAINLVAQSFGRRFIKQGDEIVLTHGEHHANIVPWYNLAKEVGATLKVVPFDDNGEIMLDAYEELLNDRVKIVATTHVANALGTVLPVKAMTEMAHRHGIPLLVDGAQSISHMPIDVQDIDCDFFVFSGHKVFAPTGIGVLYGKKALLDQMPPWQGGGNMIKDVTFERITFQPPPGRFEAGTNNIADALGLAEALKYLEKLGMTNIQGYEHALLDYATEKLAQIKGLTIIGRAKEKAGVISFLLEGKEPLEVGKALDQKGIAVRAGHHCALPILRRYGVEATVRPAFAMYNTYEEADRLAEAVREIASN